MKTLGKYPIYLFLFVTILAFTGSQCSSDTTEPTTPKVINPPTNVSVTVDAIAGVSSFAIIKWDKSPQHDDTDFRGYIVITYVVNQAGEPVSTFDSTFIPKVESRQRVVQNIERGVRYKSYVYAVNIEGKKSTPFGSVIFAGVYYGEGTIDEFKSTGPAQSGYGWNPSTGEGTQYSFGQTNYPYIDLHMRTENNVLSFYSPKVKAAYPGARDTKFAIVSGTGQSAFDLVEGLEEPTLSSVSIVKDNVYLLKTQDSIYVKVWVRNIKTTGSGTDAYQTAEFEYKIQPIVNLRVVKR